MSLESGCKVSVLIATYRTPESWLARALESLVAQTYPHTLLECILVDDGGGLTCEAGIASIRRSMAFESIQLPGNRGPSAARNAAAEVASGDFLFILDADDALCPTVIEECVAAGMAADADLVVTDKDCLDESLTRRVFVRRKSEFFELRRRFRGTPFAPLLHANFADHATLFRREAWRAVGGCDETLRRAVDLDLVLRMDELCEADRFVHVPSALYLYRLHSTGISGGSVNLSQIHEVFRRAYERRGFQVDAIHRYPQRLRPYGNSVCDRIVDGVTERVPWIDYDDFSLQTQSAASRGYVP